MSANRAGTIHTSIAAHARRTPDAVAVEGEGCRLTYAELDRRANQLAHRLIKLGVRPGSLVAVFQERTGDLVVSMLAVLKTGAGFVPLHADYPAARHSLVMAHSRPSVLLLDTAKRAIEFRHDAAVLVVDEDDTLASEPSTDPAAPTFGASIACVMHTSGSTGLPKGVALQQSAIVHMAEDECWSNGAHERVLFHSPYAFDVSLYQVWIPLLNGNRVIVAPPGPLDAATLRKLISDYEISAVHLIAGLFGVIADEMPTALAALREVHTGGDVIAPGAVCRILEACPGIRVQHGYGPTETTLLVTHGAIEGTWDVSRPLPLGQARTGMRVYILDAALQPVAPGEVGELFIGGPGVALGYLHQPALTAERFLPDLFGPPGTRMYATGDVVRQAPDGALLFLGRGDDQVKVRGFRVELGEVETAIGAQPGVNRSAVVFAADANGTRHLTAFAVAEPGTRLSGRLVRTRAAAVLPDYMVPKTVHVVESLPLTPNGKVDRRALATLHAAPDG